MELIAEIKQTKTFNLQNPSGHKSIYLMFIYKDQNGKVCDDCSVQVGIT